MTEQTRFPMPKPSDMASLSKGHAPTIPTSSAPSPEIARSWQEDAKPKQQTMPESNVIKDLRLPLSLLNTKTFVGMLVAIFVVGIAFGAALFGGSGQTKQPQSCVKGIVSNPDADAGIVRCGLAPRGERCLLFVMNNIRREVKASELFDRASQMSNVMRYRIDLANVDYASTIIKPGYIAQIVIPKD